MADQPRKRTARTLAALAMIGALMGSLATSSPAAASDRLGRVIAPVVVGAAIYYGLTHGQRSHLYDRGYYFNPANYYYDEHRGHWRARSHQRRHNSQQHYRQDRHGNRHASRHNDRRSYSSDRGHSGSRDRGRSGSRNNGNNGRRGHDDHNQGRDHGRRGR